MTAHHIKRISFLRHAHSAPAGGDQDRVLSPKGLVQAFNLKKTITADYDLIICSTAKRTSETASILAMASTTPIPIVSSHLLYLPKSPDDINTISKLISSRPYATSREMMSIDTSNAWQRYADDAYNDILAISAEHNASRLLVISHSTITNLLGLKFIDTLDQLMDLYLAPCEGYSIICNR